MGKARFISWAQAGPIWFDVEVYGKRRQCLILRSPKVTPLNVSDFWNRAADCQFTGSKFVWAVHRVCTVINTVTTHYLIRSYRDITLITEANYISIISSVLERMHGFLRQKQRRNKRHCSSLCDLYSWLMRKLWNHNVEKSPTFIRLILHIMISRIPHTSCCWWERQSNHWATLTHEETISSSTNKSQGTTSPAKACRTSDAITISLRSLCSQLSSMSWLIHTITSRQ